MASLGYSWLSYFPRFIMTINITQLANEDAPNPEVIYNSGQACCCPLEAIPAQVTGFPRSS